MLRFYYYASRLNEFDATLQQMINGRIRYPEDAEAVRFVGWLLYVLTKMGRSAACTKVYNEVRKTRILLSSDSYANVIRSCDKEDSEPLKQIMQDMKNRGVNLDIKTYLSNFYFFFHFKIHVNKGDLSKILSLVESTDKT